MVQYDKLTFDTPDREIAILNRFLDLLTFVKMLINRKVIQKVLFFCYLLSRALMRILRVHTFSTVLNVCIHCCLCVFATALKSFSSRHIQNHQDFLLSVCRSFFGFSLFLCCSLFLVVNFYSVSGLFSSIFNWLFYLSRERNTFSLIQQVGDVQRVGLSFFYGTVYDTVPKGAFWVQLNSAVQKVWLLYRTGNSRVYV